MDTLLTEIISFSGTAKGIPAYAGERSYLPYFSTLRVLKPLGRIAQTIMDPHLGAAPLSAPVGFAALLPRICADDPADQDFGTRMKRAGRIQVLVRRIRKGLQNIVLLFW
jgi:hypothetical protein